MERYTAGDIYPKIQAMSNAMANETDERIKNKYMQQIDGIMRRRKTTNPDDISFDARQKWFSRKYVVEFLRENGYPSVNYGVNADIVKENPYDGKTMTVSEFQENYDNPFGSFIGIDATGGFAKQFLKYLNGENVTSSGEDAQERIKEYKDKCRIIEEQFNAWMQQHVDIAELAEQYNRKFNGFTPFEYEDAPLGLQGVSPQVKLHGYQNAAIRRMSEEGDGILAHNVGLGKTYSALGLYAYNKQMGRSKRTCIVVPKSVLGNWYHESKKFLGNHEGCLFVGFEPKKDKDGAIMREPVKDEAGNPQKNRHTDEIEYQDMLVERGSKEDVWEAMWKIPQSNYSLVVMTKDKFGMIPMRPESKQVYADKMVSRSLISEKMHAETLGTAAGKEGRVTYQEDVAKTRLEQQFSDEGTKKKGELPYFEDMGFTDVIVDEAHAFKNNLLGGEHYQDVAYLPTAPTAKSALDMTMKMAHLRESNNGRGVYMLSATPVTNSPFEIFNMLSYVCPLEEFERYGIYTPDDFIRTFGDIKNVDKMGVNGDFRSKDGLTGFKQLDGLRSMFHKYVNMKTAEDFPDQIKLPPFEELNLDIEMTDEQKKLYESLRERAKEAAKPPRQGEKKESMFSVIRDMDRVTTDIDLYNKTITFVFRAADKSKAETLIAGLPPSLKVKRVLDDEEMEAMGLDPETSKGRAQDVTVKLETQARTDGDSYTVVFPREYENLVVSRIPDNGIVMEDVSHPIMPKYARLIENLRADLEANGKQIIFTEEKTQHQKILRVIVHHIPTIAKLIGIINAEEADGAALQKISDAYNSGSLKFVICNKKAEVGVNLQKGTTAIHHLTLPWTPASIQQRNGRGVRQGNTAAMIHIYYYCGKGSFDAYRLDVLKSKANWMSDLFTGNATTAENANALSQDDMMDMLESDPEAAKKRRMEKLAAKQSEEMDKERKRLANQLQQLSQATVDLTGLDAEKEAEREKLKQRIPELEAEIKRLQERGLTAAGDERARLGSQIISKQGTLKNAQTKLGSLDKTYEDKRTKLTSVVKQTTGLLRQKAKNGQLPFDESLIDKPENACATFSGAVIAVGDCYEYSSEVARGIIKITAVDPIRRAFQYEDVIGRISSRIMESLPAGQGTWGWYLVGSISKMETMGVKKVSYSEAELNLKKILAGTHVYSEAIDGTITKEMFLDHWKEITWNTYALHLIFRGPDGKVEFSEGKLLSEIEAGGLEMVYPEPNNENFRKEVCEYYIEKKRNDSANYYDERLMSALFGGQYEGIAAEYGTKATEKDVLAVCARAWEATQNGYIADKYGSLDAMLKEFSKTKGDFIFYPVLNMVSEPARDEAHKLGDNTKESDGIISRYILGLTAELSAAISVKRAEMEKAEQDAVKNDPRFKEIPAEISDGFAKIGITVKTNMAKMTIPGFKGGRGTPVEPFEKWFFQDKSGKNGRLFRTKDILKARYNAKFLTDAGDSFAGAWWHVPSTVDLKAVYDLIA